MDFNSFLLKKGLSATLSSFVNGGRTRYDTDRFINEIFESKEQFVSNTLNFMFNKVSSKELDLSDLNDDEILVLMTACNRLGYSIDKSTTIYSILMSRSKKCYDSIMSFSKSSTYGRLNYYHMDYEQRKAYDLYSKIINLIDVPSDQNWKNLVGITDNSRRWYSSGSEARSNFIAKLCKDDYTYVTSEYIKTVKKKKAHEREPIYLGIIRSGMLDKKTARKMRSDASESCSLTCVTELFNYANLYSQSQFKELFLQFSDSNYYVVRRYLANNVDPKHLVSLMGTSCSDTKDIIKERLSSYMKEKEGAENG